jgi:subtilisin family serine protease
MRRVVLSLLILATISSTSFAASRAAAVRRSTPIGPRFVPGEILAIRRAGDALDARSNGELRARDGRVAALLARHGLSRWSALDRPSNGASSPWIRLASTRPDFDPVAAARELEQSGAVVAAAPNLRLRLFTTTPNDYYLGLDYQYWVNDPGDADIQLADAWDVERGDTATVIGIMDTGIDRTHPDLAAQIWRNWGEIPGNSIDDDGDGYVDDVNGWDFGNDDADPNPNPVFDEATGIDIGFHGTFVAALAAAATDNSEGIAGASWHSRLLPLKVADDAGNLTLAATTAAFRYAWTHHVSVLNMSLGTSDTTARAFFQAMVDSATDRGVMCVAAAGNDGTGDKTFPAACDRVLAVASTNPSNQRSSFSNFGPWVDVAAPGEAMWSAICQNYVVDDFSQIFYIYLWGWDGQDPYMGGDGTSFACPVASGVAALVRSRWPYLTPEQVIQHLIATGDAVAYDESIGPKLNALRAVSEGVLAAPIPRPTLTARASAWPNPFHASLSFGVVLPRAGGVRVALYDAAGRNVRTLVESSLAAGAHRMRWDGTVASGEVAPAGIYFAHVQGPGLDRTLRLVRLE